MLNSIIRFSLQYRTLVLLISFSLLGYGAYVATQMPIDVFPDLDRPRVVVLTECPGLATEEVETLVTQPIELSLLGSTGVEAVRSQTTASLSVIYVEFNWSIDVRAARQTVQERLSTMVNTLPQGIRPQMTPTSSIMGQIVLAGIYRQIGPQGGELVPIPKTNSVIELLPSGSTEPEVALWKVVDRHDPASWTKLDSGKFEWRRETATDQLDGEPVTSLTVDVNGKKHDVPITNSADRQMALRTLADWVVRPRLRKIPGVAEVFVQGGDRKQYQILVDPSALLEYGVTLQQVDEALREGNINTSGGFAIKGESERPIRILGRLGPDSTKVLEDLKKVPIHSDAKRSILLGQVARIVEGPQSKRGDGSVNGRPAVVFTIAKQPHVDTRDLTDKIEAAFREIEATLPPDITVNSELFRLKNFIDRGIFNVSEALVIGAILVIIILFLFLMNVRTTFITLTAIPLSLVITMFTFQGIGFFTGTPLSINVMTLGGIAVAMGELVDDAIVDVENIFRRLRENNALESPKSPLMVVYEASQEIRSAIVFGTMVVILVFLPLFALSGVEGRLFTPLAIAYITSILASLVVSLTVTPVLSYFLLPSSSATHHHEDGFLLIWLKRTSAPLIRFSMTYPITLLILTWIGVAIAGWKVAGLGRDFLPQFDEGSVQVSVTLPAGSSLDASNRTSNAIDRRLREMRLSEANPKGEILHFVRRTGRAELDEHAAPVNASEYILAINPNCGRGREEIIQQLLTDLLEEAPGADLEVEQPLSHLISHMVSGVYAQIAIKVHGDDITVLRQTAERIKQAIADVPGLTPPVIEPIRLTEELHIRLRPEDLAYFGISRSYVANILQTALQGEVVSQVLDGQRRFDLLVRLEEAYRTDFANLGRLRIDLPNDRGQIELRELADIGEGLGPNAVNRENGRRRIVVRCNTRNRDLASAVKEVQKRIQRRVELHEGYFLEYGGQFESQQRATNRILILAAISVVGMLVVLLILFPSLPITLQILNALPTAFIGGVMALVITNQSLTVASLVGFISLGGIAVRNGILLVTHYFHLMKEEGEPFSQKMILRGSLERLAPVLMTALTAGIGLIPLVVGGLTPGREILYPVATVILGGLVTSTFCEFLIHPGLFWRFTGKDAAKLSEHHEQEDFWRIQGSASKERAIESTRPSLLTK